MTMQRTGQVIETWRIEYNTEREHSSLGKRTSLDYAQMLLERTGKTLSLIANSNPARD